MLNSDNPDLNEAGKIEARLRRKDAEHKENIRNFFTSVISKIKCGKLHFEAVSKEIKFNWVNNYDDFKRKFEII